MSAENFLWRRQFSPRAQELTVPLVFSAALLLVSAVYLALDFQRTYNASQHHYEIQAARLADWVDRYFNRINLIVRDAVPAAQNPCLPESQARYDRELTGLPISRLEVGAPGGVSCVWSPKSAVHYLESCFGAREEMPVRLPIELGGGRRLMVSVNSVCLFGVVVPDGMGSTRHLVQASNAPKASTGFAESWSPLSGEVTVAAPAADWPLSVEVRIPKANLLREWASTVPMQASLICGLGLALWFGPMALVRRRFSVEGQVKAALKQGDFFLAYLPTVDLKSLDWIGAEALLRWRHSRHGVLMPTAFIPWIEESPLIYDTTRWVMIQVAQDLKRITICQPDFSVSVNVPPKQFSDRRLLEAADEAFGAHPLAMSHIVLELIERQEADFGAQPVREVVEGFRQRGAQFALDDFGIGFSNLALLQQLEVDFVKIDRSFLRSENEGRDPQVLEAMVQMVRQLGAVIIVEGVETEQQLRRVRNCGVRFAQGFFFSRPIEIEVLLIRLATRSTVA